MKKDPQKAKPLALRKETLRQLDAAKLQNVAAGVRIWKPVGFADDTSPIYGWEDDTLGP